MFEMILKFLFPKTISKIVNFAINYNRQVVDGERQIAKQLCKQMELGDFIGKYIIVIGNNWGPPHIGKVTEVVFLGEHDSSPFLQTECVFTGEKLIHFGKHVIFTYPILKALMSINPYERWAMLTNQETFGRAKPDNVPDLITYETMEKSLLKIIPKD